MREREHCVLSVGFATNPHLLRHTKTAIDSTSLNKQTSQYSTGLLHVPACLLFALTPPPLEQSESAARISEAVSRLNS